MIVALSSNRDTLAVAAWVAAACVLVGVISALEPLCLLVVPLAALWLLRGEGPPLSGGGATLATMYILALVALDHRHTSVRLGDLMLRIGRSTAASVVESGAQA